MKAIHKLRAYWNKKENDLFYNYPMGFGTSSDAHFIHNYFQGFCEGTKLLKELDERGYDVKTIKFSIEPKKGNGEKFASQRIKNEDDNS